MDWRFEGNKVAISERPRNPLKMTATRLGAALGLDAWNTPFGVWSEITRVYKKPFEESKFTLAGKAIEPIVINWYKDMFEVGVMNPQDFFGNTFAEYKYDFYKGKSKIFGGMWDAKIVKHDNTTAAVIEIKTSGRPQDWVQGVPTEKLLQALLYGAMEKAPTTYVSVSFLTEKDYQRPEEFVVTDANTRLYAFDTEKATVKHQGVDRTIRELMQIAEAWWVKHVDGCLSPEFDEERDKEILAFLRTQRPDETDESLAGIIRHIKSLQTKIEVIRQEKDLDSLEDELKNYKEALKRELTGLLEGKDSVEVSGWKLSSSNKEKIDTKALKADGLYDKYASISTVWTLREAKEKEL